MCTDKWMDGQPNRLAEKSMDRFIDSLKDLYSVTFQPKSKIKLFREITDVEKTVVFAALGTFL